MSAAPHALAPSAGAAPPAGEAAKRPHVTIRGLSKHFDATVIYDNFDLERGRFILKHIRR
jgi:NitT/TauT family transport system ATP-binding protein